LDAVNLGLKDAVVVVTGGARGIGAAIVECSSEGAIPVIVDRDEAAVIAIQQKLRQREYRSEVVAEVLTPQYRTWLNKFPDPNEAERKIT
jgi:L-fucose dehydrogenase